MKIRFGIIVLLWFVVFTVGLKINAADCDNSITGALLFVVSATTTNVGILAVLAALLCEEKWWDAIRRGFTIYLMLISGIVVLFTESLSAPTPSQYAKIAGTMSLACLITSYKPEVFTSFLNRIATAIVGTENEGAE